MQILVLCESQYLNANAGELFSVYIIQAFQTPQNYCPDISGPSY